MEYNLGMMSASSPKGRGTWRGGSEPPPRLGLRGIVTSPGLGRGPIKFYCGAFLWLKHRIRNSVKWQWHFMKGSKSRVCLAYPALQYVRMHRPTQQRRLWHILLIYRVAGPWNETSKERNVQGTNRPGSETSKERNVHCVRGTKRLGNEKSINPRYLGRLHRLRSCIA